MKRVIENISNIYTKTNEVNGAVSEVNKRLKISNSNGVSKNTNDMDIFKAAKSGNLEEINKFLNKGVDINITDKNNYTPLHHAVIGGHNSLIKFLVTDLKAEVNLQDKNGYTPLYIACLRENLDIVKLLLENNASPNLYSYRPQISPLAIAAVNSNVEILDLLLTYNAKVNEVGTRGTALHAAARADYKNISKMAAIKLLLKNKAEVTEDPFGFTPQDYLKQDDTYLVEEFDKLLGEYRSETFS